MLLFYILQRFRGETGMVLHDFAGALYNFWIALYDILFWPAAVALVASALWLLFSVWPEKVFPSSRSSKREEIVADLKARNIVRLIIAIALAGVGFVATFMHSVTSFNRDLRQRTDATISESYAKAIAQLGSSEQARWLAVGSLLLLAKIVDEDPTYHNLVYRTVAEYLVSQSQTACQYQPDIRSSYAISPELNIAAQILADRNLNLDPPRGQRQINLERICLSKAQLLRAQGFYRAWMPRARLYRVDMREANLQEAHLEGAMASVMDIDTWSDKIKEFPDGSNPIKNYLDKDDYNQLSSLWADFSNADFSSARLDSANFQGANLEYAKFYNADLTDAKLNLANLKGGKFDGAIVTRTHFDNVINFDGTGLAKTCVRKDNNGTVKENQPKGLQDLSIPECQK
jgi:uncharacterized protein YjbI with pentapeptide repeats